jgi:hypothetical protein
MTPSIVMKTRKLKNWWIATIKGCPVEFASQISRADARRMAMTAVYFYQAKP